MSTKIEITKRIDELMLDRMPDWFSSDLKFLRKEYGDKEISDFLCDKDDPYSSLSPLVQTLNKLINEEI